MTQNSTQLNLLYPSGSHHFMSNQQPTNMTTGTNINNHDNNFLLNATSTNLAAHNNSSYDSNRQMLMKHELYQAKRQLADAQNSYQFVKREKLRVEHEKNLLEIHLRQVEEAEGKKMQEEDARNHQVRQLTSMYEEEKE
jgi:hypothetical protein